jgi:hypothetical protein
MVLTFEVVFEYIKEVGIAVVVIAVVIAVVAVVVGIVVTGDIFLGADIYVADLANETLDIA